MATDLKNLSLFNAEALPEATDMKFGIVVSEWNVDITGALLEGALKTLSNLKVKEENIHVKWVPGSFELTLGAQFMAEYTNVDAVICLGCVIQGETPHFDFICQSVTKGITDLNMSYNMPFVFGVLTTKTLEQAKDRAGGKHGNKGDEAAVTAIKMVGLQKEME
ncbi:MAG TPA: 6,7-dimethyl-8-ribityllumazine synthase [Bacteroidales bacterium]|nr:6,7-dimethyl-8-ribityllumazine synthase [Bacteroidales bacterium]